MAVDWDVFRGTVLTKVEDLARSTFADLANAARDDVAEFLEETQVRIGRWNAALEAGQLTQEEYDLLVRARQTNLKMAALQQAGVAQNALERFRLGVISIVIETAFALIPTG